MPSDLVREQDFILRVRRMQRTGTPCLVLNFVLNAVPHLAKSHDALEAVQKQLQEFARVSSGTYSEMSNGDVFIAWEGGADAEALSAKIVAAILPEQPDDMSKFLLTYHMPRDYTALRERTNHYVEVVRAAATVGSVEEEAAAARGQLTARNVDRVEQVLEEIDLRHYGRTQNIYQRHGTEWQVAGEEYFISFGDLHRERFPKLEFVSTEHLFLALCGFLDQRLLAMLTANYDTIGGKAMNLNLAVSSIVGSVFAQFVRRVPREHRPLIGFELHRGDLFQDFSLTLGAMDVLKREGFRVALDSVTPDMVNYVDLAAFPVDTIKINVSRDRALQLEDRAIRQGLEKLPPEKLVFFRCDNERALTTGIDLGVKYFQGWLIDDKASRKS
ncbi:MAG: EAL domain-containing protein [Alphaproteobacteria bacterium]|nr:EAL domain-containing protein [Alphaproteobacteria bacterium]